MTKSVALFDQSNALPAHLQSDKGLGNEHVDGGDVSISRIDLIQSLSPQIDEDSPSFIEGAKLGMMFDNVTGELYDSLFVVNLHFKKAFSVFKDRKAGGGFEGMFDSEELAKTHIEENELDPKLHNIAETHIHTCLMLDSKGAPKKPVTVYMSGSKLKISKAWNSSILLKGQGADRFATVWVLTSAKEKNRQGQPYQNYKIDYAGFAPEALYASAKDNYLALTGQTSQ